MGIEPEYIDASPSAAFLMESIRDFGYTIETAIADLVDNSISAEASNIEINLDKDENGQPMLTIDDDGFGMTEDELLQAMRLCSKDRNLVRSKNDLGRFGMGLKTSSLSQCRQLTVETTMHGLPSSMTWDLDEVKSKNDWSVRKNFIVNKKQGTKVIWKKIDRANLEIDTPSTNATIRNIREHLGLVFHRFIDIGNNQQRNIKIKFNNIFIDAFNPFNENNFATIRHEPFEHKYQDSKIKIQSFILPHKTKVKLEEWEKYEGNGGYTKNQGFYVYREGRLIINGTWFGLLKKTEYTKFCRVKIDISNEKDTDWKIDIKKSNASPPKEIRDMLDNYLSKLEKQGVKVYTRKPVTTFETSHLDVWKKMSKDSQAYFSININNPIIKKFISKSDENKDAIRLIENTLPYEEIFRLMSDGKEVVIKWNDNEDESLNLIKKFISDLKESNIENQLIVGLVLKFLQNSNITFSKEKIIELL